MRPAWIGVELKPPTTGAGADVVDVVPRSPASRAGLLSGDLVTRIDGQEVPEPAALVRRIRATPPGSAIALTIVRKGQLRQMSLIVEAAPSPEEQLQRRFVGRAAPSLEGLTLVAGDLTPNWAKLQGELVVLEFWSPWCGVCQYMHKRLNEWQTQWANHGVKILGIAALLPEDVKAHSERLGIGYAVAADQDEAVFRSYDVFAVPSLFLVDRRGRVVDATTGYSAQSLDRLEKRLIALIGTGAAP